MRDHIVLHHAIAVGVHRTEVVLRGNVTLVGGETIPLRRLGIVVWYAVALSILFAEV